MVADLSLSTSEVLVLRPSKRRWSLFLLGSVVFVAGSIGLIATGAGVPMPEAPFGDERSWGVAGLILFGLGIPASLAQMFSSRIFLRLTPDGFTIGRLTGQSEYRWSSVGEFETEVRTSRGINIGKRVVFDGVPIALDPFRTASALMRSMGGRLPDTYGMKAEDLAALMNERRDRYARSTA